MKLEELKVVKETILCEKVNDVYEEMLSLLLIEEDGGGGESSPGDGGTPPDVTPSQPPVTPPPVGSGWYRPGPFRPGGGMNGNHWFNEFYKTLKNLIVANNVLNRMKELKIGKEGQKRIKLAAKVAARNVNLLLSNPGATAYKIPVWTFDKPTTPKIKRWNEGFAFEFKKQLSKLNENELWQS